MNKRLLKYKLETYDYRLINNKKYNKRMYCRLMCNYLWNEYKNIDLVLKCLIKYSKTSIFKILNSDLKFIIPTIEKEYDLDINSSEKQRILKLDKCAKYCKYCNSKLINNGLFCNNSCSNKFKAENPEFRKKLSNSIIQYYNSVDKNILKIKNKKIRESINETNSKLSSEEKSKKYANKTLIYDSFENQRKKLSNLTFLFDKEFYYKNRELPVKCNKCEYEFKMTKTTNIARTICVKCSPSKKGKTQKEISDYIESLNFKVNINDRTFLENRIELDILSLDNKFAIEFNGLMYHSFGCSKHTKFNNPIIDKKYHLRKTEETEKNGFQLFHIFENEFKDKKDIWKSIISNKLGLSKKIPARKCLLKELSQKESYEFLELNHMQGNCNSTVKLGLFFEDELLSVMTFRKHKKYQWEIARFANKLNTTVIGGASKLLKYFEKKQKPEMLLSFANRRWSQGNLYDNLGFEFIKNTEPNHFWFKPNENVLYSREVFQKHKLKDKIARFEINKTAFENMFENGYRVIFDCGNKKYLKSYVD